jgi:ABC-type amino acid transport system permease subunit
MNLFIFLGLAFLTGFLTKLVDFIEDDKFKLFKHANILFGFVYGVIIGLTIVYFDFIAALWLGIIAGLIISVKIDAIGHIFGIIGMVVVFFIYGIPKFSFILFSVFLIASFFDEIINSFIADKRKIKNKALSGFFRLRPVLEIVAFIVALVIGNIFIWLGLLSFDISYNLTSRLR